MHQQDIQLISAVALMDSDGRILLAQRPEGKVFAGFWQFPGGKIEAGETFGFIGPNGAGKSTTIRFLATLLHASRGTGEVAGCDVKSDPIGVRQAIGYMPDHFGVYDGMRVWEFLDFFAVAYRIGKTQRKQIIGNVLELLDLGHKRNDFVNGLSRGMKQRLCLAKTLVHDPPVLILDEPASGLDPRARIEVKALLKEPLSSLRKGFYNNASISMDHLVVICKLKDFLSECERLI